VRFVWRNGCEAGDVCAVLIINGTWRILDQPWRRTAEAVWNMADPHPALRPGSVEPKTRTGGSVEPKTRTGDVLLERGQSYVKDGTRSHDPEFQEAQHGGLEVAATETQPGLEAVEARPGLSTKATWEKPSTLPESTGRPNPPRAFSYMNPDLDYRASSGAPPRTAGSRQDGLICGLRRHTFYAVVVIAVLAVLAAVALGVGLGFGLHRDQPPAAASPTSGSGTSNSTGTGTSTALSASVSLPAPTASAALGPELAIGCVDNLTLYSVPDTNPVESFLFLCGRDYRAQDGAVDLLDKNVSDFTSCLTLCAAQDDCVAASWGSYQNVDKCWLKASLGNVNWSEGWHLGVRDNVTFGG
jgi:hypothetical protein